MNLINIQIMLSSSPCVAELELDIDVRNVKMNLFIHSENICHIIYHPYHEKPRVLAFVVLMEQGKDVVNNRNCCKRSARLQRLFKT